MTKDDLKIFLQKNRLGVLSTVSQEGDPQSAVVAIVVTDGLDVLFDTVKDSRKWRNLQADPRISFVVGWENERTVQYEGVAEEPKGEELEWVQKIYFGVYPDGVSRLKWPGITYFRVRPKWIRYSDFNSPGEIVEFGEKDLKLGKTDRF
jgi:general stress protein 26